MKKVARKEKKPKITLEKVYNLVENLASSTKHGFDEMNERFNGINGHFKQIDKHFDHIESTIGDIKKDLNIVKTDVAVIKTDLWTLDGKIGVVSKRNREDIDTIAPDLIMVKKKVSV